MFKIINKGDFILLGLSGGADSVYLFHALNRMKEEYSLTVECAHVNHLLRGEAADGDMEFVSELCKAYNIKLHILREDAKAYAAKNKLSLEEAGRVIRYGFFGKIISQKQNAKIATAHTKDDNAETMLFNLIKGNVPLGIKKQRAHIIRPLINTAKIEIIQYLEKNNLEYRIDQTNFSTDFVRNKIRIELIPQIKEKFNQNFTNTVYNASDVLENENDFMEDFTEKLYEKLCFGNNKITADIEILKQAHSAILRRLIKKIFYKLGGKNISYKNIVDVENLIKRAETGKKINLPDNIIAEISYNNLIIFNFGENPRRVGEKLSFLYELKRGNELIINEIGFSFLLSEKKLEYHGTEYELDVAYDKLVVRNKKDGDKIFLKNISGHKKVSNIFTDKKIPRDEREKIPIILHNDKIVLIPKIFSEISENKEKNYLYIGETNVQ